MTPNPLMDAEVTQVPSRDAERRDKAKVKRVDEWRILHAWLIEVDRTQEKP